jgi:hypothetical protein
MTLPKNSLDSQLSPDDATAMPDQIDCEALQPDQVMAYVHSMTNDELIKLHTVAYHDLEQAALEDPNSEWHQSCFAAVVIFSQELVARGLTNPSLTAHQVTSSTHQGLKSH